MFEFSLVDNVEFKYGKVCYFYRQRNHSLTAGNTYNAIKNKITGDYFVVKRYIQYYTSQKGNPQYIADLLMANLWDLLFQIARLPAKERHPQIKRLRYERMFPFTRPFACSLKKSYMTTRTDIIGKVFDKVYINTHRPWGFAAMVLLQKIIGLKKKLEK